MSNPKNKLESTHLDYYTESGQSYFYGPSKITTNQSIAIAKKGYLKTRSKDYSYDSMAKKMFSTFEDLQS